MTLEEIKKELVGKTLEFKQTINDIPVDFAAWQREIEGVGFAMGQQPVIYFKNDVCSNLTPLELAVMLKGSTIIHEDGLLKEFYTLKSIETMETKETKQVVYKLPDVTTYVTKLKKSVKDRKGKVDGYILLQIERTARLMRRIDKLEIEMDHLPTIIRDTGSTGQDKSVLNPILPIYDKLTRTLAIYMKALGLNYDIAPEKVSEADVVNADDPLTKMLSE